MGFTGAGWQKKVMLGRETTCPLYTRPSRGYAVPSLARIPPNLLSLYLPPGSRGTRTGALAESSAGRLPWLQGGQTIPIKQQLGDLLFHGPCFAPMLSRWLCSAFFLGLKESNWPKVIQATPTPEGRLELGLDLASNPAP